MKNTDYECICRIETKMEQRVWTYSCTRRDKRVALICYYSPSARHLTMPIIHVHALQANPEEGRCMYLDGPCQAYVMEGEQRDDLVAKHDGQLEPGIKFWQAMMKILDDRGIPWTQ